MSTSPSSQGPSQAFLSTVEAIRPTLAQFSGHFATMVGKPLELSVDWDSLDHDPAAIGGLLNVCLGPLFTGLAGAARDPQRREEIHRRIDRVVLRRVRDPSAQAVNLGGGELEMIVCIEPEHAPSLSPEQFASIMTGLVDGARASEGSPAVGAAPTVAAHPAKRHHGA